MGYLWISLGVVRTLRGGGGCILDNQVHYNIGVNKWYI